MKNQKKGKKFKDIKVKKFTIKKLKNYKIVVKNIDVRNSKIKK